MRSRGADRQPGPDIHRVPAVSVPRPVAPPGHETKENIMRYLLPVLLVLVLLPACRLAPVADETSPSYPVPAGSTLVLNRPLAIPDGSTGVRLQGGAVKPARDVNEWHPNCRLEVRTLSDRVRTVEPDRFEIWRVRRETTVVTGPGTRFAELRADSGGPTFLVFRTLFDLRSARQPDVAWLTCQHWGDPALGRDLSIREIRTALGDVAGLVLPAAGAR